MAAKDYTFAAGWMNIYLTKKTKPRKDGTHLISEDRRPLAEEEMIIL